MNVQLQPDAAFDVLGIVTSAGGLEAMSPILSDLPREFACVVLVGQHLGGDSSLVDILTSRTLLPVQWASDGERLYPGRVYVVPPLMQLEVLPDLTCLLTRIVDHILKAKPLDAMLRSLAQSCGPRALAVVLTGMGNDGAAGARAVKNAGGAVLVQSQASAAYPDMPRAAIDAGAADLVLPLAQLSRAIVDVVAGGRFPEPRNESEAREVLLAGPGPARSALREVEWSANPLGPVLAWPQSLRAILTTVLHSRFPTCLYWGEQFIQIYNDAWIAVLGSKHPGAAGLPARSTWVECWPTLGEIHREVLQTGEARELRNQLYEPHRDGFMQEAFFTLSHSPLHDDRGKVDGVMTVATETTESVLAERRLQCLRALSATAAGSERVSSACERAARLLEDNARDISFALFYLGDEAGELCTLCAAAGLRQGSALAPHAINLFDADALWPVGKVMRQGSPLVLDDLPGRLRGAHAGPWPEPPRAAMLLPLRTERQQVAGVLVLGLSPRIPLDDQYRGFLELVSQQVSSNMAEARLRELDRERIAQLAELDRAKTEFFSNISHEFRTPLTLILGPLEDFLASRDSELTPLRHELELATRNANRLLNLVDTLLDFSQIEAGRLSARFEPTDASALTADISSLFRSAAERAGLVLKVDCPPAPFDVRLDRGMWEKIVSNLLSNALKFTFQGGIEVRLRYLPQHVELEVSDTGVGIADAEQPHVFRRFHRVRGARGRTGEGAGIGLSIVNELVRLHYGRVRVRSKVGQGTTFTVWVAIRLPRPGLADAPAAQTRPVARQLAEEASRWSAVIDDLPAGVRESALGAGGGLAAHAPGARILVADDNVDMRAYLARTLGQHWSVVLAVDGAQALALARNLEPDLILADVMMPVLDGFALLHEVRADNVLKATPVVLVTARAHEEAAIEGLLAGADDYVAKPFSSRELVARVGAQLELSRVRRQGERQVRELLALMPVAVYSCDREGRFTYWNRAAVDLWGGEPTAEDRAWAMCGAPQALSADGSQLTPDASTMARVFATGEALLDQELAIVRADCVRLDILLNVRPLHEEGSLVGAVAAFVDVTARKHAERTLQALKEDLERRFAERTSALQASESLLSAALQAARMGTFDYDPASDRIDVAAASVEVFGLVEGQPPQTSGDAFGFVHPEDVGWHRAQVEESLRERKGFANEFRIVRPRDGRVAWIAERADVVVDPETGAIRLYGVHWDVTEQRRGESSLRESEERLQALAAQAEAAIDAERRRLLAVLDQAPLAVAIVGPSGEIVFRNRVFDALWGRPAEDTRAVTYSEAYGGYHADGRPLASHEWPAARAVLQGETVADELLDIVDARGRRVTCSFNAAPIRDPDGGISGGVVLFRDVSQERRIEAALRENEERHRAELVHQVQVRTAELRQSRDLLKATMDTSRDMIQVFEAVRGDDGGIIDFRWVVNNQASQQRQGDVLGESLLQRNPGVLEEGIFDAFKRVVETGEPMQAERHYVHEQFDGWFFQSAVKLGDGVAITAIDITGSKAAEAELKELRGEVPEAKLHSPRR